MDSSSQVYFVTSDNNTQTNLSPTPTITSTPTQTPSITPALTLTQRGFAVDVTPSTIAAIITALAIVIGLCFLVYFEKHKRKRSLGAV